MADRYSGDLKIGVAYDDRGDYRTAVSRGGKLLWRGRVRPAPAGFGRGVAYDSPQAYDEIAESALAFAVDDLDRKDRHGGSVIGDHAEYDDSGFKIRRVPRFHQQYPAGSSRKPKRFARDASRDRLTLGPTEEAPLREVRTPPDASASDRGCRACPERRRAPRADAEAALDLPGRLPRGQGADPTRREALRHKKSLVISF